MVKLGSGVYFGSPYLSFGHWSNCHGLSTGCLEGLAAPSKGTNDLRLVADTSRSLHS